jgi:hypothetical protein
MSERAEGLRFLSGIILVSAQPAPSWGRSGSTTSRPIGAPGETWWGTGAPGFRTRSGR